jgi:NTP pyrophosphatase (non-canonical NTP hydrolase)
VNLTDLQQKAHTASREKGWWDDQKRADGSLIPGLVEEQIPAKLCLIHSEVSEAVEEFRSPKADLRGAWVRHADGTVESFDRLDDSRLVELAARGLKPEGFLVELADNLIRCGDLAGAIEGDLEAAVRLKMTFNETRPHRHGGKRA